MRSLYAVANLGPVRQGNQSTPNGYRESDLVQFFGVLQIPVPQYTDVSIDLATNSPGNSSETTADISIAAALAPVAKFVVYFAPNTIPGLIDAVSAALIDTVNAPDILSISFGTRESRFLGGHISDDDKLTLDGLFQDGWTRGITTFVSSGDNGATDGILGGAVAVLFPASSPNVTACGGTTLTFVDPNTTTEVVWNNGPGLVTGCGVSEFFSLTPYQIGANVPSSPNLGFVGRGLPDVAGHAGPYSIVFKGQSLSVQGTSTAPPLWAALMARINQLKGRPAGFLNPVLYGRLAQQSALNDITQGNNGVPFFSAGVGWDACTGFGSPNGALIAVFIGPPTVSSVVPALGPVGGGRIVTTPGDRFIGTSSVFFGLTNAPSFNVDSDQQISVLATGVSTDDVVDVRVTTQQGTSAATPNDQFDYFFPIPVVTSVFPSSGSIEEGDQIVISGLFFTGAKTVSFQGPTITTTVSVHADDDGHITTTTPVASDAGPVHVTVQTPGATSGPTSLDVFTYVVPAPVVTGLIPNNGSVLGGDPVTIVGSGFANASSVDFGGGPQPQPFTVVDDTHIATTSPGISNPGTVDVRVTSLGETSDANSSDEFTYS